MRMDTPIKHRCLAAGEKARDPLCSSNRQETKSKPKSENKFVSWTLTAPLIHHHHHHSPLYWSDLLLALLHSLKYGGRTLMKPLKPNTVTVKAETWITQTLRLLSSTPQLTVRIDISDIIYTP